MTFARLLLEIRRRAAALPDDGKRREAIELIAREVLADIPEGEQVDQVRRILTASLGLGEGERVRRSLLRLDDARASLQARHDRQRATRT